MTDWRDTLGEQRAVPAFSRLENYLAQLSLGDRVIAYFLFALITVAALAGLYELEHHFLIAEPAYGGSLTEGEVGNPRFVNPLLAISDPDRDLTALTYAGLMGEDGSGNLVPVLAQSYTVSPDGKTYTFILRPNAEFSDGTEVTANDVVFTVQKAQDAALKSPEYADWAGVSVAALDSHTVQFTLAKPYAPFLENTTLGILPARLWQGLSDEEFPFSTLAVEPVGAGPFKVASVSRDASGLIQSYTLVENPDYVLGRPYLDSIRFVFYPEQQDLTQALANGSIGAAYGVPAQNFSSQQELTAPYSRVFGVFFNPGSNAVFARPEVRKALSLAIDRQNIVNNVLGGYAAAINGPVPPGSGIPQASVPDYADPTAEAASILEAGGWVYDGTLREWKNAAAKLTLSNITIRTSNVPELKSVATAVKADWQNLGIETDIELYEPGDLDQNVIAPRQYDALIYGEVVGQDEDLYPFWDSSQKTDPGLNIADYTNKNVDALLEDARQTASPTQRLSDLSQIESQVSSDYPAAFLYAPDFIYAVPSDLHGVELPQITTPSDRFATVASWYRQTQAVWPFLVNKTASD